MDNLKEGIKKRIKSWGKEIFEHKYLILISLVFLIVAIILEYLSGNYVDRKDAIPVPDFFLSILPTIDLSILFIYGIIIIILVMFLYPLFFKVNKLHNIISQFSLLVIIRSIFICLTHLKLPAEAIVKNFPWILKNLTFGNDLFFSGHVALPFLGFLLFEEKSLKYFFLISSIIMAITVLLMHIHYSIDVFAAFFITYGTYKIGEKLFKKLDRIKK